jgi:flavodoxin I
MKKTGIFFSYNTVHTKKNAEKIKQYFDGVEMVNAETITEEQFMSYDNYILGVPTWFDGELPNYWDEFVPAIEEMNLEGKTFAIFGLGNQIEYPENFGDAVGIMAYLIESKGGKVIGETEMTDYKFENSRAVRNEKFAGLILDEDIQPEKSDQRIEAWIKQIKSIFDNKE